MDIGPNNGRGNLSSGSGFRPVTQAIDSRDQETLLPGFN
jgi:hypothetical protein